MARGKKFTPDSGETDEIGVLSETDPKAKPAAGTKVALVKPTQADEEKQEEVTRSDSSGDSMATFTSPSVQKQAARPKVGRSAAAAKKKSQSPETKSDMREKGGKSETKNIKSKPVEDVISTDSQDRIQPRMKDISSPPAIAREPAILSHAIPAVLSKDAVPLDTTQRTAFTEPHQEEKIHEELAGLELSGDWAQEHSRPWSFKSILFGVVLFVVIIIGFMKLFSVNHRHKNEAVAPALQAAPLKIDNATHTPENIPSSPVAAGAAGVKPADGNSEPPLPPASAMAPQLSAPSLPTQAAVPPAVPSAPSSSPFASVTPPAISLSSGGGTEPSPQEKLRNSQELLSILDKN